MSNVELRRIKLHSSFHEVSYKANPGKDETGRKVIKSIDKAGLRTILDLRINNLKGTNSSGGFHF